MSAFIPTTHAFRPTFAPQRGTCNQLGRTTTKYAARRHVTPRASAVTVVTEVVGVAAVGAGAYLYITRKKGGAEAVKKDVKEGAKKAVKSAEKIEKTVEKKVGNKVMDVKRESGSESEGDKPKAKDEMAKKETAMKESPKKESPKKESPKKGGMQLKKKEESAPKAKKAPSPPPEPEPEPEPESEETMKERRPVERIPMGWENVTVGVTVPGLAPPVKRVQGPISPEAVKGEVEWAIGRLLDLDDVGGAAIVDKNGKLLSKAGSLIDSTTMSVGSAPGRVGRSGQIETRNMDSNSAVPFFDESVRSYACIPIGETGATVVIGSMVKDLFGDKEKRLVNAICDRLAVFMKSPEAATK